MIKELDALHVYKEELSTAICQMRHTIAIVDLILITMPNIAADTYNGYFENLE